MEFNGGLYNTMSRGYRLHYVAAGGFLAIILSLGLCAQAQQSFAEVQRTPDSTSTPDRQSFQEAQREQAPANQPPSAPAPDAKTEDRNTAATDEAADRKADLQEQRRMADAAEEQIIVNAVAAVLMLLTLAATAYAARSAGHAAQATERAVEVTANTAKVELRAYLAVIPAGIDQLIGETKGIGLVDIRNVGKLPARNVFVDVRMRNGTYDDQDFPPIPDDPVARRVVQPGAEMRQGSRQDSDVVGFSATDGRYVYVWGVAWYNDGYGCRRYTRFCHRYTTHARNMDVDWTIKASRTQTIFDRDKARYHEHGNDAD